MKLTDLDKLEVVQMYQNGISMVKIAKKFNVSPPAINNILKVRKVKKEQKYKCDYKYFDIINNENKAYWLGFIFGDGAVKRNNALIVELGKIDIDHISKFIQDINSNHKIYYTNRNCAGVAIGSIYLCQSLIKYGIIPNKTYLTNKLPLDLIPQDLQKHFIRGLFDADGWITENINKKNSKKQHCFGFSSYHMEILNQLKNWFLKNDFNNGYFIERIRKNQKVCQFILSGNKQFVNCYKTFYENSKVYLNRKLVKITAFLKYIEEN